MLDHDATVFGRLGICKAEKSRRAKATFSHTSPMYPRTTGPYWVLIDALKFGASHQYATRAWNTRRSSGSSQHRDNASCETGEK